MLKRVGRERKGEKPQKRTKFDSGFLGSLAGNTPDQEKHKSKKRLKNVQSWILVFLKDFYKKNLTKAKRSALRRPQQQRSRSRLSFTPTHTHRPPLTTHAHAHHHQDGYFCKTVHFKCFHYYTKLCASLQTERPRRTQFIMYCGGLVGALEWDARMSPVH
jgi:hypothetical protein